MNDKTESGINDQAADISDPRLYRSAFEHAGVGMALLDSAGRFVSVNPEACRLWGYTQSELTGMAFRDVTYADDLEDSAENVERLLRGEVDSFSMEKRYVRKDGQLMWAQVFVAVIGPTRARPESRQDDGAASGRRSEPVYVVAQFHDITRLKETETALARETDLLNALMDTIPDYIYFKDLESRFIRNSRSHARLMGFDDPVEAAGKTDFDVFSSDHAADAYADEQHIIETGEPIVGKRELIRRADGQFIWGMATKVPLRDRSGRIIGTVGITRDVDEQMRIQDELDRQRHMLQAVLDTIPDHVVFKDRSLACILSNKVALDLLDKTMEEVYGKTDADLFPPEDAERYRQEEMQAIRTDKPVTATRFVRGSRYSFWEECIKMPLRDDSGEVIGVLSVGRDVTQRMEMEQRLHLTQFAMDHTVVSTLWVSPEGRFLDVNEAACRTLGYSREELLSMHVWDIDLNESYGPEMRPAWWAAFQQAGSVSFETAHKARDGRMVPVEMTCQFLSYGGQEYEFALAVDITARKRAQSALREERNLLRTLIDALPDHIYVKDLEGRYLLVNQAQGAANDAVSTFGYGVGYTDLEMLPADVAKVLRENDLKVIQSAQVLHTEEFFAMPDGTLNWGWTIKVPLLDEQGRVTGLVGVTRDITALKQTEEALKAERSLLRTLIDALPDHIYVKDVEGRYLLVNQAQGAANDAVSTFGYGVGYTDLEMLPADMGKTIRENDLKVIQTARALHTEEFFAMPDGTLNWGWTIKVPLQDEQGRVTGLVGVTRDITALKQTEEALKAERNLLRTLIDALPDHIYVKDMEGRYLLVNQTQGETIDRLFASGHGIGKTDFDLMPEHLAQHYVSNDRKVLESGEPLHVEEILPSFDANERVGWSIKVPLRDEQGRVTGLVGVTRDITELKRTEEVLEAERNLLRTLIDAVPDYIYVKDVEGRYLLANRAQGELIDAISGSGHGVGKTDFDLLPEHMAQYYRNGDRKVLESGEPLQVEEILPSFDGKQHVGWTIKVPLRDEQGRVTGLVGVTRDITDQKALEEQLRQSQKMEAVGTLAGGVAHDFNNLLTSIIGYADFLIESLDPLSPQYQDAVGIKRVAERAASLTRQLLAFSRRQVLRPQVLNLNAVVTNTLKMLSRLVGEDIELVSKLRPELGQVKVDPTQIDQVLMNLAVNAREAMPNGGRLTIETANVVLTADDARKDAEITPGAYVALLVSDTGVGVATEVLPRLFDPFFTTKEMGSGLGLATVYGIVKQSGGHIQAFSERGKGTTFTVYLPSVAEEVAEKAWREADTPSAGGSETVLVVEDDEAVRTMLVRALRRYGYDVLEATSGEEALRLCQNMEKPPDLLVTDVVMPGQLNGRQLVARLGTSYPALKVVYISGYMDVTSADEGNLEPGAVFLQKPFTPTTLAKKVRQALDG